MNKEKKLEINEQWFIVATSLHKSNYGYLIAGKDTSTKYSWQHYFISVIHKAPLWSKLVQNFFLEIRDFILTFIYPLYLIFIKTFISSRRDLILRVIVP